MKNLLANKFWDARKMLKRWKNRKIVFCYFHPSEKQNYTPLDVGYIIASIKDKHPNFTYEILEMSFTGKNDDSETSVENDVNLIKSHNAETIFFFLDNIALSGGYALIRAKKIAGRLKEDCPGIKIGFQSYKISEKESREIYEGGLADFVIRGNPMHFFQHLDDNLFGETRRHKGRAADFETDGDREENSNFLVSPSPYLNGTFDKFLARKQIEFRGNFKAYIYSSVGCPFKCHYCFRGTKSDKIHFSSAIRFYDELEYLFNNFGIRRFMLLDDVFIITRERLEEFMEEFQKRKERNPGLENISLTAMIRPELVSENFIPLLKKINIKWLKLGLQTINPRLQHYMRRGISVEKLRSIMQSITRNGIGLYLDVIMGLPNDTLEYFKKTIDYALELKPNGIQVIQFRLNPGTHFYLHRKQYGIVTEKAEKEFSAPFVCEAAGGVNDEYFTGAVEYVTKNINEFPAMKWRLESLLKKYISPGFW